MAQTKIFLPPPRMIVPEAPPPLTPGAPPEVRQAHARIEQARLAREELESCRPGGQRWLEARMTDVAAVLAGREPTALARLLEGESARYGRSLALASSLPEVIRSAIRASQGVGRRAS